MMGDPITKVILTASSMASYYGTISGFNSMQEASYAKYLKLKRNHTVKRGKSKGKTFGPGQKMFACAGDDHVMLGSKEEVLKPPRFLESMGFEISWEKYRVSKRFVHYCQDFGFSPRLKTSIKIDNVKMRLVNQFQKMGSHGNFEFPDPLIGKAKNLERDFRFMKENWENGLEEGLFDHLKRVMPAIIRCGMPSFFEEKIFKDPMAYAPTKVGGIGIPNCYEQFMESHTDDVMLLRKAKYLLANDPTFIGKKETQWQRGIRFQTCFLDLSPFIGNDKVIQSDYRTAFQSTAETLNTGSATPSSMRRVTRQVHRTYINLMEPLTVTGSKESAYSEIYSGRARPEMARRKNRARQILSALRKMAYDNAGVILAMSEDEFDWGNRAGVWVSRADIHSYLGIGGNVPNLSLSKYYFEGVAGRFEPTDSLSLQPSQCDG
jgi:hypothetical protein